MDESEIPTSTLFLALLLELDRGVHKYRRSGGVQSSSGGSVRPWPPHGMASVEGMAFAFHNNVALHKHHHVAERLPIDHSGPPQGLFDFFWPT